MARLIDDAESSAGAGAFSAAAKVGSQLPHSGSARSGRRSA
jgi:hypothetical protein